MFIRNRDKVLLDELAIRVKNEAGRMSALRVASIAHINRKTVDRLLTTGMSSTIILTRVADALNCDVVFIQRATPKLLTEIPGAEEQLFKLKKRQAIYKENERNRTNSLREEFERAERNRDFASDDAD